MSNRLSDAMNKLTVDSARNSLARPSAGVGVRPGVEERGYMGMWVNEECKVGFHSWSGVVGKVELSRSGVWSGLGLSSKVKLTSVHFSLLQNVYGGSATGNDRQALIGLSNIPS